MMTSTSEKQAVPVALSLQLQVATDMNACFCIGCGQPDEPDLHDPARCPASGGKLDAVPIATALEVYDDSCLAEPDLDGDARALHCVITALSTPSEQFAKSSPDAEKGGVEMHPDDRAVDLFAARMKTKLAMAREKGRGGWDDPAQCSVAYLQQLLHEHIAKGDPVDVANFCMMLSHYDASTSSPDAAGSGGEAREAIAPLNCNDLYRFMDTLKLSEKREVASAIGFDPAYVPGERDVDRWKRMWLWAAENDKKPALAAAIRALLPTPPDPLAAGKPIDATQTREAEFIAAIHERTPTGAWIAVQHHPDGDWSVAKYPLPWLPGEEVAVNAARDPNGAHFALTGVDGMTVMTALPAWPRNDHTTMLRLMLASVTVDEATIATWTDDQCREADVWSCSVHLSASDNDDIRVPSKPAFLPSLAGGKN